MNIKGVLTVTFALAFSFAYCHPEKGKWSFEATQPLPKTVIVTKSMFTNGSIDVKISCITTGIISYSWILQKIPCWKDHFEAEPVHTFDVDNFASTLEDVNQANNGSFQSFSISQKGQVHCNSQGSYLRYKENMSSQKLGVTEQTVNPDPEKGQKDSAVSDTAFGTFKKWAQSPRFPRRTNTDNVEVPSNRLVAMPEDGIYMFILEVSSIPILRFNSTIFININMKSSYGYLSRADYPFLPFYGVMCAVYLCYAMGWLAVSFMRWRELLRVQYWIGAVILIGMFEKALFTGLYESVNKNGDFDYSMLYFAEIVSCFKRTLSRILVIIVAFGFGIVKPRLGNVLHRMFILGLLYFMIASIEACFRASKVDNAQSALSQMETVALIPLAILETVICWWVFSALVNTILTLSLRKNSVKLKLYRHFKNILIFCVVVSVIFMIYCIFYQNLNNCVKDWKHLWINTAFWHVLFAFILLAIMTLWRPTINNQRFAFSPLLDSASEDEEEKLVAADVSDTMKFRQTRSNSSSNSKDSHALEEDLQWLDENIPTTIIDKGFPSVDSDEEVIVTKFEISKMQ